MSSLKALNQTQACCNRTSIKLKASVKKEQSILYQTSMQLLDFQIKIWEERIKMHTCLGLTLKRQKNLLLSEQWLFMENSAETFVTYMRKENFFATSKQADFGAVSVKLRWIRYEKIEERQRWIRKWITQHNFLLLKMDATAPFSAKALEVGGE